MDTTDKKTKHFFWRLLKYIRPYWFRLTIGILAGMLVGGSLFVTLMMIPQVIGVVETEKPAAKIVSQEKGKVPGAEIVEKDPQLAKILRHDGGSFLAQKVFF